MAGARIPLQVDIGFGDAITPKPVENQWAGLLDFPAASLLVYPPETEFDRATLAKAVQATFARRGSTLPDSAPLALTPEFAENPDKNTQWNAFVRKGKLKAPAFPEVIARLTEFLIPLIDSNESPSGAQWRPAEGWIG